MRNSIGTILFLLGLALAAFGVYKIWRGDIFGFLVIACGVFFIFAAWVVWTGRNIAELVDDIVTFFIAIH